MSPAGSPTKPTREQLREMGGRILAVLELSQDEPYRLLLDQVRCAVRDEQWEQALRMGEFAVQQAALSDDTGIRAAALVCRAMLELARGELYRAGESFLRAARLFHLLDEPANEGAAAFGYAYARAALEDAAQAVEGYQRARDLFRGASDTAYAARAQPRALLLHRWAARARRHLEQVMLAPAVEPGHVPRRALLIAPVGMPEVRTPGEAVVLSGDLFLIRELTLNDRPYTLHSTQGRPGEPLVLEPGAQYIAIPVPPEQWPGLDAWRGDYVLLRRPVPPNEPGWVVFRGPGGIGVRAQEPLARRAREFRRLQPGGMLREPSEFPSQSVAQEEAGGEEPPGEVLGYVVAVLKPVEA